MSQSATTAATLRVFYSWQSDAPERTNKRRIREALSAAAVSLEDEFECQGLKIIVDEATRDVSGSPNIPQTIIRKIRDADVFVADITTINSAAPDEFRRVPNPNVMFELGYAVAQLGWQRILLLFNESLGAFPQDVAFDIDRHRAYPYRIEESSNTSQQKQQAAPLKALLITALRSIITNNPLRGEEESLLTPEQQQRINDIGVLREIFGAIYLPMLDRQIDEGPFSLPSEIFQYYTWFDTIASSSLFHVYDPELQKLILRFHKSWRDSLSHGSHYAPNRGKALLFITHPPEGMTQAKKEIWEKIEKELRALGKARDKLVRYVRTNYLEIDITALSDAALEAIRFESEYDRPSS